jgi:polyhydroxyalkanoate synthesis regulator protein
MKKRRFIKYMNRKLYDRDEGSYITMEQLSDLVWDGIEIEVKDDRTSEDYTVFTLARILYDRCRENKQAFDRTDLQKLLARKSKSKAA